MHQSRWIPTNRLPDLVSVSQKTIRLHPVKTQAKLYMERGNPGVSLFISIFSTHNTNIKPFIKHIKQCWNETVFHFSPIDQLSESDHTPTKLSQTDIYTQSRPQICPIYTMENRTFLSINFDIVLIDIWEHLHYVVCKCRNRFLS